MRYCHNCHKITTGEPLFCHSCGSTYDAKLCPARHINPRWATVCSECGSRDLSTPAPRGPWWLKAALLLVVLFPGVILALLLILAAVRVARALLYEQAVQGQLVATIVFLAFAWWLYLQLPRFIQEMFGSLWPKRKGKRQH